MNFCSIAALAALVAPSASAHLFDSCAPPSPRTAAPHILLFRADLSPASPDDLMTVSAYAGLVSRDPTSPLVAIITKPSDLTWFSSFSKTDVHSLSDLLQVLPCKDSCSFALANLGDDSTSAALSYAAASENTLVATAANAQTLVDHGINEAIDLTGQSQNPYYAINNMGLAFNDKVQMLQAPSSSTCLSDLAVKCRALTWWNVAADGDCKLTPGDSVVIGWGGGDDPEWGCVHAATEAGAAGMIAADWANNLATLSSLTADIVPPPTPATPTPSDGPRHTVSFLMSDGDNVQWVLNDWGNPEPDNWYNSPDRGSVPLGWTLAPSLSALAPTVMNDIYSRASPNDEFVAGPSGAGYSFPNDFPTAAAATANAEETRYSMDKSGQRIVNVIADEATADDFTALLKEDGIDAVLFYQFNGYSELGGKIEFVADKPVIGGRFSLWSPDFYNVTTLVAALAALPNLTDSTRSDGYSLIPVHAWSHTLSDVLEAAALLEKDGRFDVVMPGELVRRVAGNVKS